MVYVCAENFVGIEVKCWRGQISIITVQNSLNGMLNILWFKRAFGQPSSWPFPACLFLQSTQLQAPPILTTAHIFLSRPPAFVPHSLNTEQVCQYCGAEPLSFSYFYLLPANIHTFRLLLSFPKAYQGIFPNKIISFSKKLYFLQARECFKISSSHIYALLFLA